MPSLSERVLNNIRAARSLDDAAPLSVGYRNFGDLLDTQADRFEDKPFLIFYDDGGRRKQLGYREFHEQVSQTANYLLSAGIVKGDRVATMSHNHSDVVIQYFAAFLLGAVVVPLNVGEDDKRIQFILNDSGSKLVFVRDTCLDRVKAFRRALPALETIVLVGERTDSSFPWFSGILSTQSTRFAPPAAPSHSDDALIVYTSGTTGNPKGVLLSQGNLLCDAMAITEWHRMSEDQRMMCVLPIHHVNGLVVTLVTPLYFGGAVVLNQRFHTDRFFERISIERVNVVSVVPTLLQYLLHATLEMESYKLAQFRHIICGAGPLTVELVSTFEERFKIPVVHGYGLSETTCYSCFLPIDLSVPEHRSWLMDHGFPSIGVPLPVNDMAIHDEHGNERNEGERGEIVIRGHNVMKEYFENPPANEAAFTHGWFRSGDEGFFRYDEQGRKFFFITGRIKELIIRGGVNISPFEIDEVLMSMPGVQAGIAVGFDNDWYGEEVGAYVTLKPDMTISEEEIIRFCRKHLPFGKSPKVVVLGNDIPVTSTGKYQRTKLKDLFTAHKGVQFSEQRS